MFESPLVKHYFCVATPIRRNLLYFLLAIGIRSPHVLNLFMSLVWSKHVFCKKEEKVQNREAQAQKAQQTRPSQGQIGLCELAGSQ